MHQSPGSKAGLVVGTVLLVLGGAGVVSGAVGLGTASADGLTSSNSSLTVAFGGTIAAGAALMLIGIPVVLASRTTYSFDGSSVALRF
jgi:hypothetical protein